MRHLPRTTRVLTTQVNTDTTSAPKRVLVVGRIIQICENCDGFKAVKVVIGEKLVTIHCSECVPSSTASGLSDVIDDVEREDNGHGYEAEDLFVQGRAA